jgi:hypothetical protein
VWRHGQGSIMTTRWMDVYVSMPASRCETVGQKKLSTRQEMPALVLGSARPRLGAAYWVREGLAGFEYPSEPAFQTLPAVPGTVFAQCPRMDVLAACLAASDFRKVWALVLA